MRPIDPPLLTMLVWLLALQLKHFLADAPLQSHFLSRKCDARYRLGPLLQSAAIHGLLTCAIFFPALKWAGCVFGLFDGVLHFAIDYWRTRLVKYTIYQRGFWVTLGLDHLLHNVTYIAMVFIASRGIVLLS